MQLRDISSIGIIILVSAIILALGSDIVSNVGEQVDTLTVTNETQTFANNTAKAVNVPPIASITAMYNDTANTAKISSSNYAISDTGSIVLTTNDTNPAGAKWFTYESRSTLGWRTTHNATEGVRELSGWFPTIALVVAAAVVIGVIPKSYGTGGV